MGLLVSADPVAEHSKPIEEPDWAPPLALPFLGFSGRLVLRSFRCPARCEQLFHYIVNPIRKNPAERDLGAARTADPCIRMRL